MNHSFLHVQEIACRSRFPAQMLTVQVRGLVLTALGTFATPDRQADCRGCHDGEFQNGMFLNNNRTTTIQGAGNRKVYQVMRRKTASIGIEVTNAFGGNYGLSLLNLTEPGYNTATSQLGYTGDASWANRIKSSINYFIVGPTPTSPTTWTYNLGISSNTPPDFYLVQMQMAGEDGNLWSQIEDFYVEVPSATLTPPTPPVITSPTCNAGQFTVTVATEAGYTYSLGYKATLTDASWMPASQVVGDGASKRLIDSTALGPQRFYRVKVQ